MSDCAVYRRPINEDIFVGSIDNFEEVLLAASKCKHCDEVSFGKNNLCPNCGCVITTIFGLQKEGRLSTFSVVRHRPPGDYRGPLDFEPYGVGLVEFTEGVGVVTPLLDPIEALAIGQTVRLHPHILYRDDAGVDVVAFKFAIARDR